MDARAVIPPTYKRRPASFADVLGNAVCDRYHRRREQHQPHRVRRTFRSGHTDPRSSREHVDFEAALYVYRKGGVIWHVDGQAPFGSADEIPDELLGPAPSFTRSAMERFEADVTRRLEKDLHVSVRLASAPSRPPRRRAPRARGAGRPARRSTSSASRDGPDDEGEPARARLTLAPPPGGIYTFALGGYRLAVAA